MLFARQIWALAQKDLIIFRRRYITTSLRALIVPIVYTVILCYIRYWTATPGLYGVGEPSPVLSLADGLAQTGSIRPKVVIVDNGFTTGDIAQVVAGLSDIVKKSPKELHVVHDEADLISVCPSSSSGVSDCYGGVGFLGSPDHGGVWNYTIYGDQSLDGTINVQSTSNDAQLYIFPLQQEISRLIAATNTSGPQFPDTMMQFPYTLISEEQKQKQSQRQYPAIIEFILAYAFFIAISTLIYHCVGYIAKDREEGMLGLIDASMPNRRKWQCITIRTISSHIAFDLLYLPSWIAIGGIQSIAFPDVNVGLLMAFNIIAGLAMTSYSVLCSSLFKKAQLSSIFAMILAIAMALVANLVLALLPGSDGGRLATAIIFPPCTYVYFLVDMAAFEAAGLPFSITAPPPETQWNIGGLVFFLIPIGQLVILPLLGILIEQSLHGTDCKERQISDTDAMAGRAVRLQGFSKTYKSKGRKKEGKIVNAVDNLTMDIHAGSVTVLLGANGSGKSTTLTSIAGLQKITSGTIEIDGTGGLGICPQQNILWGELTVEEHVALFDLLKATKSSPRAERRAETTRLIEGCDLEVKRHARAKTLSGGQKRKLQLAMMFSGGSRVCCIDEATSGIDPLARRKIWDILLAERGHRTLLLTTHFLDEAEVLSDHVVILSKGVLRAQGSVASLKAQQGGGFRVLLGDNSKDLSISTISGVTRRADYNRAVFEVPDSTVLASLVKALEESREPGAKDYTIHGPTVEEIFLELSEEMSADTELFRDYAVSNSQERDGSETTSVRAVPAQESGLNTGLGVGPVKQTWIMFRKRLTILKHNYMPYLSALLVPLLLAGLVTRFFIQSGYPNGVPCKNPDFAVSTPFAQELYAEWLFPSRVVYGPPDRVSIDSLKREFPNVTRHVWDNATAPDSEWQQLPSVNSLAEFKQYVANNSERLYYGGFFDDPQGPIFAWQAKSGSQQLLQGFVNNYYLQRPVGVAFQPFQVGFSPSSSSTIVVAVLTTLGFAIYPGFFALYPTGERIRNVRAMQYSNGILSSSLWIAYSLFDLTFILAVSLLTVIIWSATWHGWYGLGYMFVVFTLYGLTGTAFSYVVSLFVSSQLAAFAWTAIIQVIIAMLYFTGYVIAAAQAPSALVYTWFNYIHYTVALVSPVCSLMRALFMALNNYALPCRGDQLAAYPGEIGIYGAPILYLTVQFLLLVAFLMFWESGRSLEVFGLRFDRSKGADVEKSHDHRGSASSDAEEDASRLAASNDGLRVAHLSKSFGRVQAVDDVTFGILPSEKFALLGPNGAGKSTTISLIRGDLPPDRGAGAAVYIGNDALYGAPLAAKNHLGVCPQFDATDAMTVREHLMFYAQARGVPDPAHNVDALVQRLGLTAHQHKVVRKLSGGTHRKLSLAIALVANPRVLLLDEPSSGMDPAAKRALWRTLRRTTAGRVLLLTTHSMEEAAALCDRAGILASRLLALGSIADLRRRHGPAACVLLVHRDAPHASVQAMDRIRDWVLANFPTAALERRPFGGQIRFTLPRAAAAADDDDRAGGSASDGLMGRLFQRIEAARDDLGVVDYAIGPATLDQVFLDVILAHGVQEENTDDAEDLKRAAAPRWWRRGARS